MTAGPDHKVAERPHRVVVVGAGIVGVASALCLLRDGHEVTLIDRDAPGEGCSFGNAGLLARSASTPLAGPATLLSVPKWLLDPAGPLSLHWPYLPKMLPWLFRYIRSGMLDDLDAIGRAMFVLTDPCVDLYKQLADQAGCSDLITTSDYLQVYRSKSAFKAAADEMAKRTKLGFRIDQIGGEDIQALEPNLSPEYGYGFRIFDHGYVNDPGRLVKALAEQFCLEGGVIKCGNVEDIDGGETATCQVISERERIDCDKVVLAAGAFSARLARKTGVQIPLETERGYHITCPDPGSSLTRPVMEGERKFLATPMAMGLRFAGTVELSGLDAPANPRRVEALTDHARRMVIGVNTENAEQWMGCRPTLPDSLPMIGPSPRHQHIIYAFGHQHLGLTCAPRTGQLVADLVAGRVPNVDMAPYSANRFA